MLLKKYPEDFIVNEVFKRELNNTGNYSIFLLKKTNYNTEGAITEVAKQLGIERKRISYAGLKDKRAITTQYISVLNCPPNKSFSHTNISLEFKGKSNGPISLGDLEGNYFEITVRELNQDNLNEKKLKNININTVPNYFDDQRFGSFNHIIGKHLINQEFDKAVDLILKSDDSKKFHLNKILVKNPNDFVNAIKQIQPKMLRLYVHAYQSFLWNKTVKTYLSSNKNSPQRQIPLIGFGINVPQDLNSIIDDLMQEENLTSRSFIIRQIPELSVEGTFRDLYIEPKDFSFKIIQDDESKSKNLVFNFFLPKGSYATMFIKTILEDYGSSGI